jgi:hypothetical protein
MFYQPKFYTAALLGLSLAFAACSAGTADESVGSSREAVESCTFQAPVITEVRAETPGPVAPGVRKIYHVTIQSANSAECGPVTFSFIPDSFHLFSITADPSSVAGVGANGTASFRVEVVSDPSVAEGTFELGFTVVGNPGGTTARGSLTYQVSLDNPTGCTRQAPQFSVTPASPDPVPAGTPQSYQVTVRNIDNAECGTDVFCLIPDSFRLFSIVSNGPFPIPAQGSATFPVTATSDTSVVPGTYDLGFTLVGNHHGALTNRGSVRYVVR